MRNHQSPLLNPKFRRGFTVRGFTVLELLIVVMIIAILAGMAMSVMAGATEQARIQRTRAVITKINGLIMERYESYRTRAVPLRFSAGTNARLAARTRMDAIRELMRMELPCCVSDVTTNAFTLPATPALTLSYRRRVTAGWDNANEGAECLYLILSTMQDGDKNALDYFDPREIGDTDEDGMKEILDGWGQPLIFLRWAPGFTESVGLDGVWGTVADDNGDGVMNDIGEAGWPGSDDIVPSALQSRNYLKSPDPFDPLKTDYRNDMVGFGNGLGLPMHRSGGNYPLSATMADNTFALVPLIVSMGPDKESGMAIIPGSGFVTYVATTPPNDPYYTYTSGMGNPIAFGMIVDPDNTSVVKSASADNITNHDPPQ